MQIKTWKVECHNCHFAEILLSEKEVNFERIRIEMSWGGYIPEICPRCINRMSELDEIRLAILFLIGDRGPFLANEIKYQFRCTKNVEDVCWKLIEEGLVEVDDKGVLKCTMKRS